MNLTAESIESLEPKEGKIYRVWCDDLKGLGVQINPGGCKAYVLRTNAKGKTKQQTLGRADTMTLDEARAVAQSLGAKPRRAAPHALPLETTAPFDPTHFTGDFAAPESQVDFDALDIFGPDAPDFTAPGDNGLLGTVPRRKQPDATDKTVAEGFDWYLNVRSERKRRLGRMKWETIRAYGYQYKNHIGPAIGAMHIADVTVEDVEELVDPLPPTTRNRVLQFINAAFNEFQRQGWWHYAYPPSKYVERARLERRDRTFSDSEYKRLAAAFRLATEHGPHPAVDALRVAALTGLRIGEILAMRWEHVDLEQARVTLPDSKTGRRQHDLASDVVKLLRGVKRDGDNPNVFASTQHVRMNYTTCLLHWRELCAAAGLKDARIHDLRRSIMTRAAQAGIGSHIIRDLLGHKSADVADSYVRNAGSAVADAREAMGRQIADLLG